MDIEEVRSRVLGGRCLISFTHTEKLRRRKLSLEAVEEAIRTGVVIEDYQNDPRGPSCLIHGMAPGGEAAARGLWSHG